MTDVPGSAPPAGNPPPGGDPNPPAAPPAGDTPWYASMEDATLRGLAETKGWKTPQDALASYRQLETHIGVPPDRLIKLPEKADDPGWGEIRTKLGWAPPAKAEDYGITAPEGADPTFASEAAKWMFDAELTKDQAAKLSTRWNTYMQAMDKQHTEAQQQREQGELTALKAEWGGQFDQSAEMGKRAAAELGNIAGIGTDELNAMEGAIGTAKFLKLFAAIGSKNLAEAPLHGADGAGAGRPGFMSPDVAKARIEQLKGDPEFGKALMAEQETGRAGPKLAEWQNLHKIAFPS